MKQTMVVAAIVVAAICVWWAYTAGQPEERPAPVIWLPNFAEVPLADGRKAVVDIGFQQHSPEEKYVVWRVSAMKVPRVQTTIPPSAVREEGVKENP